MIKRSGNYWYPQLPYIFRKSIKSRWTVLSDKEREKGISQTKHHDTTQPWNKREHMYIECFSAHYLSKNYNFWLLLDTLAINFFIDSCNYHYWILRLLLQICFWIVWQQACTLTALEHYNIYSDYQSHQLPQSLSA